MPREMKDTGIEWIGEVPKDWDIVKLKYISDFYNGFSFDSNDLVSDYKYPVIRIGDIKSDYVHLESDLGVIDNSNLQSYLIKKDDILLAMSGATVGKVGYVESYRQAYINQRVGIIRSELSLFIFYNLLCKSFLDYILIRADGSAQPNISSKMIKEFIIALPKDVSKIKKIVNVIKSRLNIIDSLKETIESEIKTLDEYKKSIITEAVTKGLDKGAEMKDSGIEWIGQIPKHWSVDRIKNVTIKSERGTSPKYTEDNTMTKVVNQATFSKGFFDESNIRYSSIPISESKGYLKTNDILIASTGGGVLGKVYYFDKNEEYVADGHVTILRTDEEIQSSKFLYYLFSVNYDLINGVLAKGSTNQTELQAEWLNNFKVPTPPINEQKAIAEYLDHKTGAINEAIEGKRAQLVALDEYKKSLIYEYVTGKKEA